MCSQRNVLYDKNPTYMNGHDVQLHEQTKQTIATSWTATAVEQNNENFKYKTEDMLDIRTLISKRNRIILFHRRYLSVI